MLINAIIGGLIALLLPKLLIRPSCFIGQRFNLLDRPSGRKWHKAPIPCVGGMVITASIILPLMLFGTLSPTMIGLITGGGMMLSIGIVDDGRVLSYYSKFAVQFIAVVLFLVISGHQARPLTIIGYTFVLGYLYYPLVVIWMIGVINTINLIDGLDGLAGGVSLILLAVFGLLLYRSGYSDGFIVSIIVAGATLGFLRSNWPPAKIYLGDSGALLLGFILGALSIMSFDQQGSSYTVTIPLLVLSLPVLDTLFVMAYRISQNNNPFLSDRNHIHHVLLARGFTGRDAVLIIYAMTISFCILAGLSTAIPAGLTIFLFFTLAFSTILLPRLQPATRSSLVGRIFPLVIVGFASFIMNLFRSLTE